MKLRVISLGKVKQSFVLDGEHEYTKRIRQWLPIELLELSNDKFSSMPEPTMKEKEGELFHSSVGKSDVVIVLDERGKNLTSEQFAQLFRAKMNEGVKSIDFGIGGAYGWSDDVRKGASLVLSLSPMTFTYQMTRLILIEQIYRALSLVKGVPYHKS